MATKALSYLRVSTRKQTKRDGFPRQRQAIAEYAKRNRVEVVAEYTDGVSGTKGLAGRPGLLDLVARVKLNGLDLVLVEKADRLARDLVEGELILRELREAGVRVIEVEGGNDLTEGDDDNPTKKLIRQVLGAVAEYEKGALVAKLRRARERKRERTGQPVEGRKAFGYYSDEVETLAVIRRLRRRSPRTGRRRHTWQQIADTLNEEARESRSGKPWTLGMVREVVSTFEKNKRRRSA